MKDFLKVLFAAALLAAASFAQEPPPVTAPEAATPENAAPATVAEPQSEPAAVAEPAADAEPVAAEQPERVPIAVEPPPAAPEPAPVVAQPPVQAPPTPAPAVQTSVEFAPSEPITFEAGLRLGFGASQFRKHKMIAVPELPEYPIQLDPAFSLSVGTAFQIGFNKVFALAPELQYTLYRANGEKVHKVIGSIAPRDLYDAGVYMHTLELPVLVRLRFGSGYAELGPQAGLNLYSKMYSNAHYYRPDMNLLAFGAAAGGGVNLGGILTGVRGYFGILEYAKDTKGIPWGVQFSITPFVF